MTKTKDRCENCTFWRKEDFPEGILESIDFGIGLCLRFPPTISRNEGLEYGWEDGVLGKEAFFPATSHNARCGEYKPKQKEK